LNRSSTMCATNWNASRVVLSQTRKNFNRSLPVPWKILRMQYSWSSSDSVRCYETCAVLKPINSSLPSGIPTVLPMQPVTRAVEAGGPNELTEFHCCYILTGLEQVDFTDPGWSTDDQSRLNSNNPTFIYT
jgi:hypothetical protein